MHLLAPNRTFLPSDRSPRSKRLQQFIASADTSVEPSTTFLRPTLRRIFSPKPLPSSTPDLRAHLKNLPAISPASARTLLVFSLLLDPLILSQPLHPYLKQWSTTGLVLFFPIAFSATHLSLLSSLARSFVEGRLAVLSSPRTLAAILGLLGVTLVAEAALVLGRAAAPLLIVGAALGIPGTIAIVRAFRSQFILIRQKLEDRASFESAVQRTTAALTVGALLCARLCGFLTAVSLVPSTGEPLACALGILCSLSLLTPTATERSSDFAPFSRGAIPTKTDDKARGATIHKRG